MFTNSVSCPSCRAGFKLQAADASGSTSTKCPACGDIILLGSPPKPECEQSTSFPTGAPCEETSSGVIGPALAREYRFLAPSQAPDELGRLGPYRVLGVLGSGGMGAVFRAEDPALRRQIALKVMLPEFASDPSAKARFLREARAQAAVEHDHVIAIHQVGEDRGVPFIAMPLLKGRTLADALKAEPIVPVAEAVRVAREIAEGLAAAHARGLIHRDIKPGNIWLEGARDRVKILDFGLVRVDDPSADAADAMTRQGMIVGTPAYMSPEQAGGEPLDARTDLFSLGAVLYQMLTGRAPFGAGNTTAILVAVVSRQPPRPSELTPGVPPRLDTLVMRLLAKAPADRPSDAAAVAAALRSLETGVHRESETPVAHAPPPIANAWAAMADTDPASAPTASPRTASAALQPSAPVDPRLTQEFAPPIKPSPTKPPRQPRPTWLLLGLPLLGLAAAATLLLSGVIRFGTSDGDFVIDTDDPDFAFSVNGDKVLLDDKKTKRQYQLKLLRQEDGQYELEVTDAIADLTFHSKTFTIKRGDKVALKAWFERKADLAKVEPKIEPKVAPKVDPPLPHLVEPKEEATKPFVDKPGEVVVDLPPWKLPKDAPKPILAPLAKDVAQQVQADWAKYLKRDAIQETSVGMKLALIPPGEFDTVYTNPGDPPGISPDPRITDDLLRRRLRISQPFELGVTEVTVGQFRQFVEETKYVTDAEKSGKGGRNTDGVQQKVEWTWKNPGPFKRADTLPVTQVSWNDANAFCEWLSQKEKTRYRLPTEAEWEFACRAGSTSYHGVCDKEFELTQHAWVQQNASVGGSGPRPVGNWHANPFGLFDMIGNAWEWCADGGDRGSGERTHAVDPWGYFVDPNVRGPGYDIPAKDAHPAFRRRLTYDHARSSVGFRVLRQLTPEPPPGPLDRPLLVRRNGPLFRDALTQRPTPIPGLRSWSVELAGHGHTNGSITAIAWSPKGDVIATGNGGDPVVRLWDRQGKLLRVLTGIDSYASKLSFTSDGKYLAASALGRAYFVWEVDSGVCIARINTGGAMGVAFSSGKDPLLVGGQLLGLYNLRTGKVTVGPSVGDWPHFCWSPDQRHFFLGNGATLFDAQSLSVMEKLPGGKSGNIPAAWSPDGTWLCAANPEGTVLIWDATTKKIQQTLKTTGTIQTLAWSKDSKRLLSGGRDGFIIWDALAGKELLRSTGGGGPVAWSPDETEVAVGSRRLQIFDAATGLLKRTPPDVGRTALGQSGAVAAFSGKRLLVRKSDFGSGAGALDVLDSESGAQIDRWDKVPRGNLSASPTNDLLAVYNPDGNAKDKNLYLLDAATGKQIRELKPHPLPVRTVAWSPDGKWLASGGRDKIIRIWNTAEATLKHELLGHEGDIVGLAWSPDGQRLASLAKDKTLRLWDPLAGKHLSTHNDPPFKANENFADNVRSLAWNKDSQTIWVSMHLSVILFDPTTGKWTQPDETKGFPVGGPYDLALSPSGERLIAQGGNILNLIDLKQKSKRFLSGINTGGQWHPDSRRFLSGLSGIGWQRGYDAEMLEPLGTLVPFIAGDNWLVVGPTGHYAGPKNIEDHLVYVAQTETGEYITLTPAEFEKRFGWKNDSKKASLLRLEP